MKAYIKNDYNRLLESVLCYPCNLQPESSDTPFDKSKVFTQFNGFINKLIELDVKTFFVDLNGDIEQIFTRDIGFIINDILFISRMTKDIRKDETKPLITLAKRYNMKTHVMHNRAEGGDIIVSHDKIFIGKSNRTTLQAAHEIEKVLNENDIHHEIIRVDFDVSKIHLDCAFNVLDNDTCIISSDVYQPDTVAKHFKKVISIPDSEKKSLAPNIVQLGNKNLLCTSENFCNILNDNGYNAIYIEYSEIIKCSGSIGCCLLPLHRE